MQLKNRLTPYPILDDFGDDYIDSSFQVEYNFDARFSEVYAKLEFKLDNKDIQQLIKDEKAQYTVHVECPLTCFRKIYTSYEPEIEFKIDSKKLASEIEVRTFVVLTKDIKAYYSENFHPDYQGQKFDLEAHQIIATGTAKNYKIQKDDKDLDSLPSIIKVKKNQAQAKSALSVNTDSDDYIIVGLSAEVYDYYARLGKSTFKDTAFSLVLLPSLIVVIQRMYQSCEDDSVTSTHWYRVIENLLDNNGYKIKDLRIDNDSLLSVCQEIFADPIAKSFKELNKWSEE